MTVSFYGCDSCGFLFHRVGEVHECPSCERMHGIRPATEEEAEKIQVLIQKREMNAMARSV